MNFDGLRSPVQYLQQVGISSDQTWLRDYEAWFECEGQGISDAVDRAGTPWLRMFDRFGARIDMEHKGAHRILFQHLAGQVPEAQLREMQARIERQLGLPEMEKEANLERIFDDLASFTADALLSRRAGSFSR
jgi:hypothetical protein